MATEGIREMHETATVVVLDNTMILAGLGVPKSSIAYWEKHSKTVEVPEGYGQYKGIQVVLKGGGPALLGGSASPKTIFLAGHTVEGFASLYNGAAF